MKPAGPSPKPATPYNKAIADYFRRTGDPRWRPYGHHDYTQLRRAIMDGLVLDNELR